MNRKVFCIIILVVFLLDILFYRFATRNLNALLVTIAVLIGLCSIGLIFIVVYSKVREVLKK